MKDVELNNAMLDLRSLLNIVSLAVLDAIGIPRERITRQPIEISSFRGHNGYAMGFINLNLTMWPVLAAHKFNVIHSQTTYHLLLERP